MGVGAPTGGAREEQENQLGGNQKGQTMGHHQNHQEYEEFSNEREVKDSREEVKKRMLGALEGFHNSLMQNQQKLENNFKGGRNIKEPEERRYL